jgi:hypothetical protein
MVESNAETTTLCAPCALHRDVKNLVDAGCACRQNLRTPQEADERTPPFDGARFPDRDF